MSTGRELIEDSLLESGVGSPGESLEPSIINHALRTLNRLWSTWSAEIEPVISETFDDLTWTANTESMTIGTGGDLDTLRPIQINSVQTRTNNIDYTLSKISFEQYQTTILKDINTDYPDVFAYHKTYPLAEIYIYPVPSSSVDIRITSVKPLTSFTLDGEIELPVGYEEALLKNLAVRLAPVYGKGVSLETASIAIAAKDAIIMDNQQYTEMWPDPLMPGINNYDDINNTTNL